MLFVVSAYGDLYVPLLTVCLDSLSKTHPDDSVIVAWDQINDIEVKLLKDQFRWVDFQKLDQSFLGDDLRKRIPLKLRFWLDISKQYTDQVICFLDSDTLVYKNIAKYIDNKYDFIYTWKNEQFPLNVGVVIVRSSKKVGRFLELWLERIEEIISDEESLKQACDTHGAADQQALADLINTSSYGDEFNRRYEFGTIHFKGFPCEELNQTNVVPINHGSSIFHYKGGWHPILLKEDGFSYNRPKTISLEMLCLWENRYSSSTKILAKNLVLSAADRHRDLLHWSLFGSEENLMPYSELLAVLSVSIELGIEIIIVFGRLSDRNIAVLEEVLQGRNILILHLNSGKSENADPTGEQVGVVANGKTKHNGRIKAVQQIAEQNPEKKIAILFYELKGKDAFELFSMIISREENVRTGFFYDSWTAYKGLSRSPLNEILKYFDRLFFTDDEEYAGMFNDVDRNIQFTGKKDNGNSRHLNERVLTESVNCSPSLAVVVPTERDKERWKRMYSASAPCNRKGILYRIFSRILRLGLCVTDLRRGKIMEGNIYD